MQPSAIRMQQNTRVGVALQHQCTNLPLSSHVPTTHDSSTCRYISSNRSRRGLFDGKDIRSGNNVSFSMKKTKRTFKPNVFDKRLYSEILDEMISFEVSASALRSIDKAGGLDNYLLTSRHIHRSGKGHKIKMKILQRIEHCKKTGLPLYQPIDFKKKDEKSEESVAQEDKIE